jgi:hypothetical protein
LSPFVFGANNPENLIDVDGNILKDKDGNIIATANGNSIKEDVIASTGKVSYIKQYKDVIIYTDKGNPIAAKMVVGFVKRTVIDGKTTTSALTKMTLNNNILSTESVKSNCHGYAFADGNLSLGDGIGKIIEDEYNFIGKISDNQENKTMEDKGDIVIIYGGIFSVEEGFDEEFWYHTGKRDKQGSWTDKDGDTQIRKGLKSTKEVENSPLKMSGKKEKLLYERKNKKDKVVSTLKKVGKKASGIRIITDKEKKLVPIT